ncbi:MAG: acyl-CoA thioesterase [Planctomycetes bacterium]|nr:acyl-CoA thioesterase [Planctomycetota bacterium]
MVLPGSEFQVRYRLRFGDVDEAGIAYYPQLLHLCHCAMEDWWADGLGKSYAAVMHEERYGLPAAHLDVDFVAPVRYGDEPLVHVGVLELGRTSVRLAIWMTRDDGTLLCRARIRTVGVDMDTLRPVPIPAHWRSAFERFRVAESDLPGPARDRE